MKTLKAWRQYDLAEKCFFKLHNLESPGDFADWDVYWTAGITSCRTIWHVLSEQDLKGSELRKEILSDYSARARKSLILQKFVRAQRDRTIKAGQFDVVEVDVMVGMPRGTPFTPTHKDLMFEYPTPSKQHVDVSEDLQGEDALRLLGIAISELFENLVVIEEAIKQSINKPFSERSLASIIEGSELWVQYPKFYR